jgi:hypothetical protein
MNDVRVATCKLSPYDDYDDYFSVALKSNSSNILAMCNWDIL